MNPSISVITPVYNRFSLLRLAVDSILAQTVPVSEVILIDDGSIDDTPEVLPRHIAETPLWRERVRYFHQENQGQSVALNNGIARAKGEWIAFNANDDLWLPQKLEWQFKAIEKYGDECGLCFTDAWFMNNPHLKGITLFRFAETEFKETLGIVQDPVRLLLHHQPVWCQTVIARADLVRRVGGYDPLMRFSEDYDFVFKMSLETKFCYVGNPMVLIDRTPSPTRHQGAGLNWQKKEFKLRMDERRLERQLKLTEGLEPDIRKAARENMRSHYSKWTNLHLKNKDYARAREAVSIAAKYDLTPGIAFKWVLTHLAPQLATKIILRREELDPSQDFGLNW